MVAGKKDTAQKRKMSAGAGKVRDFLSLLDKKGLEKWGKIPRFSREIGPN